MSQHARNTAIFSALTLCSRISGMIRLMVFAFAIGGRTVLADSYQLAYLIPSTIYEFIVGGLLSAVFIPLLVSEQEKSGKDSPETWNVANLLLGAVGMLLTIAGLIGLTAAPWIIGGLTAMGEGAAAEEKQRLATIMFRWFTPQIVLLGVNAVCMAILNSLAVFAVTAAAPIINNVIVICVFLAYHYGLIDVTGLAIGTTCGTASMILAQLPWLYKAGMKFRPRFNLHHPVFRSVGSMGWPIVLVSIANLFGWAVRSNLLSTVLGAFAIYTMCFQLIMMPYGIFAVSIATVLYPTLSRHAANRRMDEFIGDMALGFRWTTFILLPMSLGLATLALPVVRVLFEHRGGQFTYSDSLFAASFLGYYALSIAPYALVMFATRVFYSTKDTATPAAINIAGVFFNAIVSYLLLKAMGAEGIALGATLTYVITTSASLVMIKRLTGGLGGRQFWAPMGKMLAAGLLMTLVVNAAEMWSRPQIVTMEKGNRLQMQLPKTAAQGGVSLINNQPDLARIWSAMGETTATLPEIDFSRKTLALVWGPTTRTTSTLQITSSRDTPDKGNVGTLDKGNVGTLARESITSQTTAAKSFDLQAIVAAQTQPRDRTTTGGKIESGPTPASTHPAYALVELNAPNARVNLEIKIAPPGTEAKAKSWSGFELIRLLLLSLLGAIVYAVSALLFGVPEVTKAIQTMRKKLVR